MDHLDHAGVLTSRTPPDTRHPIATKFSFVDPNAGPFPVGQPSSGTLSYAAASIARQTRVHFVSRYTRVGTTILSAAFVVLTLRGFENAPPIRHVNPPAPASCPTGFQRWWPQGREFDDRATQCIKPRIVKVRSSKGKNIIESASQSSRIPMPKTGSWK